MTFKRYLMRTIKQSSQFKRDLKREAKDSHQQALKNDFVAIITALANDQPLADKQRAHGRLEGSP